MDTEKKILNVPHLSQILDVGDSKWHLSSCGVACVSMIVHYHLGPNETNSVDSLIKEGLFINGHNDKHGWIHSALVLLLHNHGLHAYQQEFKSHTIDLENKKAESSVYEEKIINDGLNKISQVLISGDPLIVSVEIGFRKYKTSHLIVLTGVEIVSGQIVGFYFNDPFSEERGDGYNEFSDISRFLKFWKRLAIFISKKP